jgi:hypothetical protein
MALEFYGDMDYSFGHSAVEVVYYCIAEFLLWLLLLCSACVFYPIDVQRLLMQRIHTPICETELDLSQDYAPHFYRGIDASNITLPLPSASSLHTSHINRCTATCTGHPSTSASHSHTGLRAALRRWDRRYERSVDARRRGQAADAKGEQGAQRGGHH